MANHTFTAVIEKDEDGWFARVPELDGCYTQGDSYEDVITNLNEAIRLHIDDRTVGSLSTPFKFPNSSDVMDSVAKS